MLATKMSDKSVLLEFMGCKRRISYEDEQELITLCENELRRIASNPNIRVITDGELYIDDIILNGKLEKSRICCSGVLHSGGNSWM